MPEVASAPTHTSMSDSSYPYIYIYTVCVSVLVCVYWGRVYVYIYCGSVYVCVWVCWLEWYIYIYNHIDTHLCLYTHHTIPHHTHTTRYIHHPYTDTPIYIYTYSNNNVFWRMNWEVCLVRTIVLVHNLPGSALPLSSTNIYMGHGYVCVDICVWVYMYIYICMYMGMGVWVWVYIIYMTGRIER